MKSGNVDLARKMVQSLISSWRLMLMGKCVACASSRAVPQQEVHTSRLASNAGSAMWVYAECHASWNITLRRESLLHLCCGIDRANHRSYTCGYSLRQFFNIFGGNVQSDLQQTEFKWGLHKLAWGRFTAAGFVLGYKIEWDCVCVCVRWGASVHTLCLCVCFLCVDKYVLFNFYWECTYNFCDWAVGGNVSYSVLIV